MCSKSVGLLGRFSSAAIMDMRPSCCVIDAKIKGLNILIKMRGNVHHRMRFITYSHVTRGDMRRLKGVHCFVQNKIL
jgi:hypothetical protein